MRVLTKGDFSLEALLKGVSSQVLQPSEPTRFTDDTVVENTCTRIRYRIQRQVE